MADFVFLEHAIPLSFDPWSCGPGHRVVLDDVMLDREIEKFMDHRPDAVGEDRPPFGNRLDAFADISSRDVTREPMFPIR